MENNAVKLLEVLKPNEIRERLEELAAEQKALRTLLRAVTQRRRPLIQREVADA